MAWLTILLSAAFAGTVATLVTIAIERWGGLIGGLLGTIPSTIVPAAIGMYAAGGKDALVASMSVVPFGMLLNSLFLGAWLWLPPRLDNTRHPLLYTTGLALLLWTILGLVMIWLVDGHISTFVTPQRLGVIGFLFLLVFVITLNARPKPAVKGTNPVPLHVLAMRGIMAASAIGLAVRLAGTGQPLLGGLASVFPAIFLTSMVALWLAQGPTVPRGAAGPMMLGGASVAVFANIAMWSLPAYGIWVGSLLAWFVAVVGWSLPAFLVLRKVHARLQQAR